MSAFNRFSQMQKRLLLLESIVLLGAVCVEARLAYLQVLKHGEYHRLAYHQQYTPRETSASRGMILDREGETLAMNIGLFNVSAHPNQIADKIQAASALSRAIGESYGSVIAKISGDKPFVWVARQVPYEHSDAVEQLKLDGVEAEREQRRFYPDHDMAAQVLGFTGIDNQGLGGLECFYNRNLTGKKGQEMAERDARGRMVLADNKRVKAEKDGLNVVTTLDRNLQHVAQVELEKAYEKYRCKSASIAVMDPSTGEILAMANYPTFDPNHFDLAAKETWKNRMVNDEFEPGSTFKLITAVGALEEGVVNEEDKFFCENGAYQTEYGRVVTDHEKHGWLTFREVFGYSSNIGMVKVGAKLGEKNLYNYCRRFGFGESTGIDLPGETTGKLRPLDKWSGLSMTTIPYGYEVSTSPMQILDAYAAIANNGIMMRPYLVKRLETSDGSVVKEFHPAKVRRVCSVKTAKRMTEMLKWVVSKGTGTAVALPTYDIAGKTGTAYKFMNGHYAHNSYVSSFVGFVPAEKPKFVIYVSLDDPRGIYWGGYTAGPVFKEVAKRALAYAMVPATNPDGGVTVAGDKRTVPSFLGLTAEQCKWLAERDDLKLKFEGKGPRVIDQSLKAGAPLAAEGQAEEKLVLILGETTEPENLGVMPDLRGKTKRQALALLAPFGVRVNFNGQGVVKSQFPPAGRKLPANTPCDLNCDLPVTKAIASIGGNS
ncbi:MAG TPA: penicillin-binding transpeptidase domain-containing protein [bacterium]|nr:penicillin-binding transpeptidase domain-containing protein [bacterium]